MPHTGKAFVCGPKPVKAGLLEEYYRLQDFCLWPISQTRLKFLIGMIDIVFCLPHLTSYVLLLVNPWLSLQPEHILLQEKLSAPADTVTKRILRF